MYGSKTGRENLHCGVYHNMFLGSFEKTYFSGHYHAIRWEGKLPKHEKPLAIVGGILNENPGFVNDIQNLFHERLFNKRSSGMTWRELKNGLKI